MNLFEKWDEIIEGGLQRIVQTSLGPATRVEFLESYTRALEDIESRTQSIRGRRVFPYKRVALKFLFADPVQVQLINSILAQKRQLSSEIRQRLEESGCESPAILRVDAIAVVSTDRDLGTRSYEISYHSELPPQSPLTIHVLRGEAECSKYKFAEAVINIGRRAEVYDEGHRLVRRNHAVFLDVERGPNVTVSREHAHISFDFDTGWYRLYDDASRFGTRICRNDLVIEVPVSSAGGAWLRPGDEVHLGQARLRIELYESWPQ